MNIEFTRGWVLLLFPVLFVITYLLTKGYYKNKIKKWVNLCIRGLFLLCLVFALAGTAILKTSKETTTIFLTDLSKSNQANIDSEREFIEKAVENKPSRDRVGSVVFGKEGYLDDRVDSELGEILKGDVDGNYTDIEQGLMKALSIMPEDTNKRVVLLTDGKENKGQMEKYLSSIKLDDLELKVKLYDSTMGDEVYVDKFTVPQRVNKGEQFDIGVDIFASIGTRAKLTLFADGQVSMVDTVDLSTGMNRFILKDTAERMGFVNYEVLIEPEIDINTINNSVESFTLVSTSPKVLLVYDEEKDVLPLENIVKSIGLEYDKMISMNIPTQMENLLEYKSIIMSNVSAEKLDQDFLNNLESYVKDFGGGFIAIGGENAFALGGYYKTAIEKVLPVNMFMKGIKNKPKMAMMLVIDKSGSMAGQNLRLAKEAAMRSVDIMEDKDEIGVYAFDTASYKVVELQSAKNRVAIQDSILGINEGGGTSILPTLEEAYKDISKSDAEIKHIILLTDGQAESTGYDSLVGKMNSDKVTLTTVGVGDSADYRLLKYLAEKGKGRFYAARDGYSIPRIFAKEAFLSARTYLNNYTFNPAFKMYHPILSSVYESGLPQLHGYVGTSEKDTASVLLTSPMNDPILAIWQYGLGKTVAWTPDLSGEWSSEFTGWADNNLLWRDIIQYTIEDYDHNPVTLDTEYEDNKIRVVLNTSEDDKLYNTSVQVRTPDNETVELDLVPVRKGVYEASLKTVDSGAYMIKGIQSDGETIVGSAIAGVNVPYSKEFKIVDNKGFKEKVERLGGTIIDKPEDVFASSDVKSKVRVDISNLLLIVAMVLWLFDIALRRLNIINKLVAIGEPINRMTSDAIKKARDNKVKKARPVVENKKPIKPSPVDNRENVNQKKAKSKPSNIKSQSKKSDSKSIDTDRLLSSLKDKRKGE